MRLIKNNVERITDNPARIKKLKADGFKELGSSEKQAEKATKDLSEMNTQELKELAKKLGIEGYSGLKKDELLEVLKDVV